MKSPWALAHGDFIINYGYANGFFSKENIYVEWSMRFFRDAALTTIIATLIISGLRDFRKSGFRKKKLVFPGIGLYLGLMFLSLSVFVTFYINKGITLMNDFESPLISAKNLMKNKNLSPNDKSKISLAIAQGYYFNKGEIIKYYDEQGKEIDFQPSESKKKNRLDYQKIQQKLPTVKNAVGNSRWFWVFVITSSLAIGIFSPIRGSEIIPLLHVQ
jgi:hypothetical protein